MMVILVLFLKITTFKARHMCGKVKIIVDDLTRLIGEYKNEEHILNGGTINEEELRSEEENLFQNYQA